MPTINKIPKKEDAKRSQPRMTEDRALRISLYNTTKWRKTRAAYLKAHPICERCLKEGRVNAGTKESPLQVHHKRSPFIDGEVKWELAYDDDNLETICAYHHGLEHSGAEMTPAETIKMLEDMLNEN